MPQLSDGSFLFRQAYSVSSTPTVFVFLQVGGDTTYLSFDDIPNSVIDNASVAVIDITADHAKIVFHVIKAGVHSLRIYDIAAATFSDVPLAAALGSYSVCVPGTDYVATASYEQLALVSIVDGARVTIPLGAGLNPQSIGVSPDGSTVYVGLQSAPFIKAFSVAAQDETITALTAASNSFGGGYQVRVPVSYDGQYIASLSSSLNTVYVRRVSDGATVWSKTYTPDVRWVSFNPNSTLFAVSTDDKKIEIVRLSDLTVVKTYAANPTNGPGRYAWFVGNDWLSIESSTGSGLGSGYDKRVVDALAGTAVFTYDMDAGAGAGDFAVPPAYLAPEVVDPFWTNFQRAAEVV